MCAQWRRRATRTDNSTFFKKKKPKEGEREFCMRRRRVSQPDVLRVNIYLKPVFLHILLWMAAMLFKSCITAGTFGTGKKCIKSLIWSARPGRERRSHHKRWDAAPAFVLLVIKSQGQHSIHNLCVKVPFLNATKGQEVVIHQRNYGCAVE